MFYAIGLPPMDTVYENTANYVSFYRALNYKHKAKPKTRFHHVDYKLVPIATICFSKP